MAVNSSFSRFKLSCLVFIIFLAAIGKISVVSEDASDAIGGCKQTEISRKTLDDPCSTSIERLDVVLTPKMEFDCGDYQPLGFVSSTAAPKVKFANAAKEKKYVLMMLDPDAPNHGNRYWLHWLVKDIKGDDLAKGELSGAKTLIDYRPPAPPARSGKHRYQFFVFEQPTKSPMTAPPPPAERGRFDAADFASRSQLCGPLAGTQFITERKD